MSKEKILNEVKEFLVLGFVSAAFGVYFGWACARDIDKDCERECGLVPYEEAPEYCQGFWQAKGLKENAPIKSTHNERNSKVTTNQNAESNSAQ